MYCATQLYRDSKIHRGRSAEFPTNETKWLIIKTAAKLNHSHMGVTPFNGRRASIPFHHLPFPTGCESGTPVLPVFTLFLTFPTYLFNHYSRDLSTFRLRTQPLGTGDHEAIYDFNHIFRSAGRPFQSSPQDGLYICQFTRRSCLQASSL
jgi:hypothetical protein